LQNWQSTEDRHSAIIALAEARPGLGYEAIGAQFGVSGSCVSTISRARKASRDVFLTDLTGRTPGDCALAGVMFFAAWLLHSIRLAAALAIALLAMQAPGDHARVSGGTAAARAQLRPGNRPAEGLGATLLRIAPEEDEGRFLTQLRAVEPSNAETLSAALERERTLQASYDRIEHSPDLLRPTIAAKDVAAEDGGSRRQIAQTALHSFAPQLDLSFAAAVYGLGGLFLGSLIGELLTAALFRRRHLLTQ